MRAPAPGSIEADIAIHGIEVLRGRMIRTIDDDVGAEPLFVHSDLIDRIARETAEELQCPDQGDLFGRPGMEWRQRLYGGSDPEASLVKWIYPRQYRLTEPFPALNHSEVPDLASYDRVAVLTSGGKDATAAFLRLLEMGCPREKIELHHHRVDGSDDDPLFFDWPSTDGYVKAFAKAFEVPLYISYREGGLLREMLRCEATTAPVHFMRGDGTWGKAGGLKGPLGTRRKFPQLTANLSQRWCSAAGKVDVFSRLICNDERFRGSRTLVVSGERAQESPGRARYAMFEPHRDDARKGRLERHVDHWRPVHRWLEGSVWAILRRHKVLPAAAYWTGAGRLSCQGCIFSGPDQWATFRALDPERFQRFVDYETEFGVTIHRNRPLTDTVDIGDAYPVDPYWAKQAMSTEWYTPIFVDNWTLPPGAFRESGGPT
jgi:hypothetical protein